MISGSCATLTRMGRRASCLILAGVLALAGCTSSTVPGPSNDKLASVGLQLSDFPPSWVRTPAPADNLLDRLAHCTRVPLNQAGRVTATVGSGAFHNGKRRIWSAVSGYRSPNSVSARVTALGSPRAESCMARLMRPDVEAVEPRSHPVATHFDVQPGGVNTSATVAGTATGVVTVDAHGQRVPVYVDVTFFVGNNLTCDLVIVGAGKRVPARIRNALVLDVGQRAVTS